MCSIELFTQKMEVANFCETMIHIYQTARRQSLEDQIIDQFYDTEKSK